MECNLLSPWRERFIVHFSTLITSAITRLSQNLISNLRGWTKPITAQPTIGAVIDVTCSRQELIAEKALLGQQLLILKQQVIKAELRARDRAVIVGLASRVASWKYTVLIVKPETVLRWHRDLFR